MHNIILGVCASSTSEANIYHAPIVTKHTGVRVVLLLLARTVLTDVAMVGTVQSLADVPVCVGIKQQNTHTLPLYVETHMQNSC